MTTYITIKLTEKQAKRIIEYLGPQVGDWEAESKKEGFLDMEDYLTWRSVLALVEKLAKGRRDKKW